MQRVKTYFFLPAILLMAFSCEKTVAPEQTTSIEQKALLVGNALPADGCSAHLLINLNATNDNGTAVLPTEVTRTLFDKAIAAEEAKQANGFWAGQKIVTIRYAPTTSTSTLECGWGKNSTVPLIQLQSLQ
ncbi:hypothetical protein J2I47_01060 [Fibrella sp. HMF5335]|uniref:Lipoprotein n=1 Tax=Fibrella rubiginis TaxID=2817060 RepID=A0A939K1D2_9BACT|nr:hypothetical protein [Fibrella rubiginis]MBO0935124.1 hypothetical protein [Fibrella rubiginis]